MSSFFRHTKESFYDMKIKKLLATLNLNTLPGVADEADLFETDEQNIDSFDNDKLYCFKNGNTCDFYYNRIQIHMSDSDTDKSVQIYISAEDDAWSVFVDEEGNWVTDSPNVEKFRVYVWQYLQYLSGHAYDDELYSPGSWNRYVYMAIENIINVLKSCQECVKYDNIFKNY